MNRLILLIILVFSFNYLSANSTNIDSLKAVLKTQLSDTTRIKALIELRNAYYLNKDRSMDSLLVDSIRSYSKRANYMTGLGLSYFFLSDQFQEKGQIDSALFYDKEALRIFKAITYDPKKIIQTYNSLAGLYSMKVDTDSCFYYLKSALALSIKENMPRYYYIGANIGMFYARLGKYDSAVIYLNKAIEIGEKNSKLEHLPLMISSLADCYSELDLKELSSENYKKAYQICMQLGDDRNLASGFFYFGEHFLIANKLDSALKYYQKAYELNDKVFSAKTPGNLNQISICFLKLGQYQESVVALINCFERLSQYQFPKTEAYIQFVDLANVLYEKNMEALLIQLITQLGKDEQQFLEEGLKEAGNDGDQHLLRNLNETYARYYRLKGDYQTALMYFIEAEIIEDSVFTLDKTKEIAGLEKKYQLNIKEEQLKLRAEQLKSSETKKNLLAFSSALLLLLLGTSFSFYRSIKLKNRQLQEDLEVKEAVINEGPFLSEKTIILKSKKVLKLGDILYIKSAGNNLEYYLLGQDHQITERQTIKGILDQLPANMFVQNHRSYIINISQSKELNKTSVLLKNNESIPVSAKYYNSVEKALS